MRSRSASISSFESVSTRLPSTQISPSSGSSSCTTCLIVTDLPVPEPPITTTELPLGIESEAFLRMTFLPNALETFRNSMAMSSSGGPSPTALASPCDRRSS